MPRIPKQPKYCFHETSGHARVHINGQTHWLGPYDSRESRARYDALIEEWKRHGHVERSTITVDNLALRYLDHAEVYYRKADRPTSEVAIIRAALRFAVRFFGNTLACEFGTAKLIGVRDEMVRSELARPTVNEYVARIRRMFQWGCERQYVSLPKTLSGGMRKTNEHMVRQWRGHFGGVERDSGSGGICRRELISMLPRNKGAALA
jgi:hypothetical protein